MSLNGVRSQSPDGNYIRELERIIRDLQSTVAKLEKDRDYLFQKAKQ